jgi:uncharacterized repeat protein (TIGR01451 family)
MKKVQLFFVLFWGIPQLTFAQNLKIPYFSIIEPGNISLVYAEGTGEYTIGELSANLTDSTITGEVKFPEDGSLLCVGNGTDFTGKIAVVNRGSCEFDAKAYYAQQQGAIGLIIVNYNENVVPMPNIASTTIHIPFIMVKASVGAAIKGAYDAGETVVVSMGQSPAGFKRIEGYLRADNNNDCTAQPTEQPCSKWTVGVTDKDGNTSWHSTNNQGYYYAYVSPGSGPFTVSGIPPVNHWEVCNNGIVLPATADTVQVDFSAKSTFDCVKLDATISSGFMRRCFDVTFFVEVCNNGTQTAEDAYAIVTLPTEMEPVSLSSLPFTTVSEDVYRIELGDLAPSQCVKFHLLAINDCDSTVLGQTLCYNVHAYPDTSCQQPVPQWNGASVNVTATCTGSEVLFKISNNSIVPMNADRDYIIIEDGLPYSTATFNLGAGESKTISLPASGSTWRLEAEQVPFHPVPGNPSRTVEGCASGSFFTTGSFTMFPLYDPGSAQDEECKEVIGAYDPNDKQGFPKGWGELQLIRPNVPIDYLIRFQNTGTDTAFTVVIRDTLSAALDPTSIQHLKSSHDFTYAVEKGNLLTFRFDQIKLVDSFTNEPGSHGFISFRINQRPDNAYGTSIDNRAGIYFDFNPPIITNIAHHEVGEVIGIVPVLDVPMSVVPEIFPNPAVATTHLRLKDQSFDQARWDLVNAQGQSIANGRVQSGTIQLSGQTPSGIHYLFLTKNNGQRYAVKVVMGRL